MRRSFCAYQKRRNSWPPSSFRWSSRFGQLLDRAWLCTSRASRSGILARPALNRVGYRHVQLDPGRRTVAFARPGMDLDPGGIGKVLLGGRRDLLSTAAPGRRRTSLPGCARERHLASQPTGRLDTSSGVRVVSQRQVLEPFTPPLYDDYDIHPDGRTLALVRPAGDARGREITLVLNWLSQLERVTPH